MKLCVVCFVVRIIISIGNLTEDCGELSRFEKCLVFGRMRLLLWEAIGLYAQNYLDVVVIMVSLKK